MFEAEYPLTFEQVVKIVSPPRLQEFVALGYDSLQRTHYINYELGPDEGLGRRSITRVQLPQRIHYAFSRQLDESYQEKNPIYFNRSGIDDDAMEKLKQWTEKAVYERRLAALVNTTVVAFFKHTPKLTMYHIMARWPGLKVVFPRVTQFASYRDVWERHGNEAPRNLQRWAWPAYGPEAEWWALNQRRVRLVDETLLSCVSLSEPKSDAYGPRKLVAKLASWQILGGAPF